MALEKIQGFIKKLSESQNVKKVVGDIQNLSTELQSRVKNLNSNEAFKSYKDILKKVNQAETDLQKEVTKVVAKIKKSATDVEKNLDLYKKKAVEQKNKIEKLIKRKKAGKLKVSVKTAAKPVSKAKSSKKSTKKAVKKAPSKKMN